jgi:anti-anti-sigma factor
VLSGDIDLSVREELRSVLAGVVTASPGATEVDLHEVTFLDCCGVGEFIRAYIEAQGRGHTLTVSRPRGTVRRILELGDVLAVLAPEHAGYVLTASGDDVPLSVHARPKRDRMGAGRQRAADAREHGGAVDAVADEEDRLADLGSGIPGGDDATIGCPVVAYQMVTGLRQSRPEGTVRWRRPRRYPSLPG